MKESSAWVKAELKRRLVAKLSLTDTNEKRVTGQLKSELVQLSWS